MLEESRLPVNVLELRAIRLCLDHWTDWPWGLLVWIQSDGATVVAYVTRQGGIRSLLVALEVAGILWWAEHFLVFVVPSAGRASSEMSTAAHPQGGSVGVSTQWVPRFVARSRNSLADSTDALVAPWGQYRLIYAFPPLRLLLWLLHRIDAKGILVAPDWPPRS